MKEAVILAGGFGTRLQIVVSNVPKPMAPIGGQPFLAYLLDYLKSFGFEHVVLAVGYMHQKISDFFKDEYAGMLLSYAVERQPLGTGGGMMNALQQCTGNEAVVLNGDTLFRIDFDALEQFYQSHDTHLAVVLRQVNDTSRYGSVHTAPNGRIIQFGEKNSSGGSGLINGGIYMLHKDLFDADLPNGHRFATGQKFSFETDLMQRYVGEIPFYGLASQGYFIDIGVPDDYARAQHELAAL